MQRCQVSGIHGQRPKNGLRYTVVIKLHEIGGYLNNGYHGFVDNYFISVPLVRLSIS
jgi:hypothetical protein